MTNRLYENVFLRHKKTSLVFDTRLTVRLFVMLRGRFAVAPGAIVMKRIYKKCFDMCTCSASICIYGNGKMAVNYV